MSVLGMPRADALGNGFQLFICITGILGGTLCIGLEAYYAY